MLTRLWSNRHSDSFFVGMQIDSTAYKAKHIFAAWSNNGAYVHTETCVRACVLSRSDMNACNSFIYNCQKQEAARMSFNRLMEKPTGTSTRWNII